MKTSSKRIVILIVTSALFAIIGSGCRTVRGFGSDVEHTGDNIKKAASN